LFPEEFEVHLNSKYEVGEC